MKVCHLTSVHHAKDTRILFKECSSLSKAGFSVYLVAYGESFENNGVQVVGLGEKPMGRLARVAAGASHVISKGLELDCDIYHLHDPELIPYIPKLKKARKRVIFDSHEDIPQQILEKKWLPLRGFVSRVYTILEKHYLRRADGVVGVTPHQVERLQRINSNTVMITNYPHNRTLEDSAKDINGEKYICFAGRISEDWSHIAVIEALQEIEGVRYVLCGKPDYPEYIDQLKQADKKGVLDYKGIVPHNQVHSLYQGALAGVSWLKPSPNIGGSLGTLGNNKLFEQMAAGIPVICTDLLIWKEIIDRYHCGIAISSGDVSLFRKALTQLISNPDLVIEMGKNGRIAVEKEFNWGTQSTILLDLYQRLL